MSSKIIMNRPVLLFLIVTLSFTSNLKAHTTYSEHIDAIPAEVYFVLVVLLIIATAALTYNYFSNRKTKNKLSKLNTSLNEARKELNKTNIKLVESNNRLHSFMDSASSFILIYDKDLSIVDCNQAVIDIMNLKSKKDLVGTKFGEVSPHLINSDRHRYLKQILKDGKSIHYEENINSPIYGNRYFSTNIFMSGKFIGLTGEDTTDRKNAELELQRTTKRYKNIFDQSQAALWEADYSGLQKFIDEGKESNASIIEKIKKNDSFSIELLGTIRIKTLNKRAISLFNHNSDEIINNPSAAIKRVNPMDIRGIKELLISFVSGADSHVGEAHFKLQNGKELFGILYVNFTRHDLSNIIATYTDFTENRKNAIQLEKALKAKDIFLANMSHEIKTPLNAIIGFSQLLQRKKLETEDQKYVDTIEKAGETLVKLVDNVLDFSKLNANKMLVNNKEFNFLEIVQHLYEVFKINCIKKGINFNLTHNLETLKINNIFSDKVLITQVINNLLSNAIKFTPQNGMVTLDIKEHIENDVAHITLTVSDNGIGMSEEETSRIFNDFTQANNKIREEYGGTGLGLSISKKIITLLGGEIELESTLGKGTTFTINFSAGINEKASLKQNIEPATLLPQNTKVLIAEDNMVNQILLKEVLELEQIPYVLADNGKEAIDVLEQGFHEFTLGLFDIRMPVMDGYEAVSLIKKNEKYPPFPIVALSADATKESKKKAKEAGFDDFLQKPFLIEDLKEMLKKYSNS